MGLAILMLFEPARFSKGNLDSEVMNMSQVLQLQALESSEHVAEFDIPVSSISTVCPDTLTSNGSFQSE
jgi:hypothetical protein